MNTPVPESQSAATPALANTSDDWQPLPSRARGLFMASTAFAFALTLLLATGVIGWTMLPPSQAWWPVLAGVVAGAGFGAWLGNKRYRYTQWRLDGDGFALRRGRMWQSETRVPGSRVQHLDLKRGPLERHYALATLVIHTAGTRNSEVSVSGLDDGDAERLRDRLAHQTRDDADA